MQIKIQNPHAVEGPRVGRGGRKKVRTTFHTSANICGLTSYVKTINFINIVKIVNIVKIDICFQPYLI